MNIKKLFEAQRILDEKIYEEHPLQEGEDRIEKKILALLVEVGELANETRCFKYWSNKPPAPRETILEEYVDGIHFLLSLAIEFGFENELYPNLTYKTKDLKNQFIHVFRDISYFQLEYEDFKTSTRENALHSYFDELWMSFIGLGELLGFTWEEIAKAYEDKNSKNHVRQQTGY